jgi:hypothetical protein
VVVGLFELVVVLGVLAVLVVGAGVVWRALQNQTGGAAALPARQRADLSAAIANARWAPAHDEVDGTTRVLVRRTYNGLDGRPVVLEERVLESFSAQDPAWEAIFTEAMARARFRCSYLNTEEGQ